MRNQSVFWMVLGLMFLPLLGCATHSRNSSVSEQYLVTAEFYFPLINFKPTEKIEITALPGLPFAVKTQDTFTNRYEVIGTIWKKSGHSVHMGGLIVKSYYPGCASLGAGDSASLDVELGQDIGGQYIMGPGYSFVVTKK
jgi:hypothetical protein